VSLKQKGIGAQHKYISLRAFACLFIALLAVSQARANDTPLANMTLEQRVAQLFMVSIYGPDPTEAGRNFLQRWEPGGVVLLKESATTPQRVTTLTNSFQQTMMDSGAPPLLIAIDQEPGIISHLNDGFTQFPTPTLITATGKPDSARAVGAAIADELKAVGVNMNLSPVSDLETNPNNPIIKRRSFGSDPALISPMIGAFVEGTQSEGVLATAKHFPGHGETTQDSHTTLPVIDLSKERMEAVELAPFRAAVAAHVDAIMVAHIWYPALEPEKNLPASLSRNVITGLLRDEMGYDGIILTDALDMDSIDTVYSYPEAAVKAISAGADMVMAAHVSLEQQAAGIQAVVKAVEAGQIPEAQINASAQRILDAKNRRGLMNWKPLEAKTARERIDVLAHTKLIEGLFRDGITVAYDHNHLLPLADSSDAALIYPATRPRLMEACHSYNPKLRLIGVSDSPSLTEISWAKDAARQSKVAVVFTQNAVDTPQQVALVRALPPEKTVVVALWSPYDWTLFQDVAAYITTYSPAKQADRAVCGILFGDRPARGVLALTLSPELPAGRHAQ
jgi:beta-N-acetylhexosaminidase